MRKLLTVFLFLLVTGTGYAQQQFTLSGHIKDEATGETLIGANVYIRAIQAGAAANTYGFYSLTCVPGTYEIEYSYIGYQPKTVTVNLQQNIKKNIELRPVGFEVEETVITAEIDHENVTSTDMGYVKIDPSKLQSLPVVFGEQDVLKTIQMLPGIKSSSEASTGFVVRGGKIDQNLILLDEAPVYNASHIGGFFSVFNSDAIKDVKIIKGSMPAYYGGRLSSVVDMTMNDGNNREFQGTGGLGLIFSRLTLQGPIKKGKGSFILSGRRTYVDQFFRLSSNEDVKNSQFYFYDLNLKGNYQISDRDRLFFSGYFGRDVINIKDELGLDWGNKTWTARWNHLFSDRLFLNSSLIYSKFDYVIKFDSDGRLLNIGSDIDDINLKEDFQYFRNPNSTISFGGNVIHHTFRPGKISYEDEDTDFRAEIDEKYALESAAYVSHEQSVTPLLTLNYGLRLSMFTMVGPGTVYNFDDNGHFLSETEHSGRGIIKNYLGPEPRFSATYGVGASSSVKASYTRNRQYVHLLTNSLVNSPMDVWQPSTNNVKPEISDQISLGYFRNFDDDNYETSAEIYYKHMQNQIAYKNGADIVLNEHVESELIYGKGRAYGIEFFAQKKYGKVTGWLGYTISRTEREFADVDDGRMFPSRHDRTHDVKLVAMYNTGKKWSVSATWNYYTGDAVTFPSGKYRVDGRTVNYYTERNGYRMPGFHRLDMGLTRKFKKRGFWESDLNISIINVYRRKNAYMMYFRENENNPNYTEAVKVSLFRFFPTLTYNFKF